MRSVSVLGSCLVPQARTSANSAGVARVCFSLPAQWGVFVSGAGWWASLEAFPQPSQGRDGQGGPGSFGLVPAWLTFASRAPSFARQ